jgi:hypothetical protein
MPCLKADVKLITFVDSTLETLNNSVVPTRGPNMGQVALSVHSGS